MAMLVAVLGCVLWPVPSLPTSTPSSLTRMTAADPSKPFRLADLVIGNGTPLLEKNCTSSVIFTTVAGSAAAAAVLATRGKFLQHSLQQTVIHMKSRLPAVPLFLGAASATTCGLAHYRHKEDIFNYVGGAALGGAVLAGARSASPAGFGWNVVIIPAVVAVAYLFINEQNSVSLDLDERHLKQHGNTRDVYKNTWNEMKGESSSS